MNVSIPVVCDFRSAGIGFGLRTTAPKPFRMPYQFYNELMVFDVENRQELGVPMPVAMRRWNEGGFPSEPGQHDYVALFDQKTVLMDNGYGELIPVDLTVSIWVQRQLFFGNLPIKQISGFKDELSGQVITNAFTTGILRPDDVYNNWQRVDSIDSAPQLPVLTLTGLVGYDVEESI
jgi:hypothetical protein